MISGFDASILIPLFDPAARVPDDPATGQPITHFQDRLRYLLAQHAKIKGSRIIIPAPALAEFLVRVKPEAAADHIGQLQRIRGCRITPFAEKAAIEFAEMQRAVLREGRRRPSRNEVETRAKAKFDQQIVAIARVESVEVIYTDDEGLAHYARRFGIRATGLAQLPTSPDTRQSVLPLDLPRSSSAPPPHEDD